MKLKRLFTAVLSTALALSLCAMPAMAADGGAATGTTTPATPEDVWTRETGTITIHKYEYNGKATPEGTGESTDKNKVPTPDAKPLKDVEFSIYQVMNRTELRDYYNGLSTNPVKVEDYLNEDRTAIKPGQTYSPAIDKQTTKANGEATFDGLDLGLYVVVETATPDKVTSPVEPFLVSVPMTKASTLKDWLYDIHVYPKNATTYGQVTIEKNGYTGRTPNGALEGVQFTLEKATPATTEGGSETWKPVTKRDDTGDDYAPLTTDDQGKIKIEGLSQGKYRIYEKAYTTPNGYILDAAYHEFTVNANGEITYGSNAPSKSPTIPLENYRPDMEKTVYNGTSWEHDAQYGVGDTVPYKITIDVPQNIKNLSTFTVTDTPTGLTDTVSSIEVKEANATTGEPTGSDLTAIYTKAASSNGFTITFKPADMETYAGKKLVITYNATVNNDAVVGGNGNSNNAKLTYTNKIDSYGKPGTTTNTIEDSAVMYSFGIKVVKTAGDTSKVLPDVVFDLYREAKTGETSAITGADAQKVGLASDKRWILVKSGLTTGTDGIIDTSDSDNTTNFIGGLAYGDYYLVETKTAKDYNLLTKPVEVKLHVTANVQWKENKTFDESGKLTKRTVETTTFTNANADSTNQALVVAKVINRKGFTLPVTGGFGTLLFSGIGVLLVLAGVGVLFSLKKKPNRA